MTLSALGLGMGETLRPLIASAAPYIGRETPEPVVGSRQISRVRKGEVIIGTPTVVEDDVTAPAPVKKPESP